MQNITVIVPVYNDPKRTGFLLDALIKQSYPKEPCEIIIVDNGSTDNTVEIINNYIEKHPDLITLAFENDIQSSYAARNKGLEIAKGDVIAFTDSDCIPGENWLRSGVDFLTKNSVSCGGGKIEFTYKNSRPNVYEYYDSARKLNQQHYTEVVGFAATANFFIKRKLIDLYGNFRSDLISGGDYEFGRRLTESGEKIAFIPEAVIKHPARSTFRQIYLKTIRVAKGQKQVASLKLLDHGGLSLKTWLPRLRYPQDNYWSKTLRLREKAHLLLLLNYFKYINLWTRLR